MWLIRALLSLVIGTLLSLTVAGSVILLGWLMRIMQRRTRSVAGVSVEKAPGWLLGPKGHGRARRAFGGLWGNLHNGVMAVISLAIATFPFAAFWMVAWWAGWENSFNKGYEQAFVGPLLGLTGIAVFAVIMVYLPMGLAHQAAEGRAFALFEMRHVRNATAHTGWGYALWALVTLIMALPIFASRGLPVFAEGIYPGLAEMTLGEVQSLRSLLDLATGGYVFVTAFIQKHWLAGLYARAVLRSCATGSQIWNSSWAGDAAPVEGRKPHWTGKLTRFVLLILIWTGLAVLIFVGQFLNHAWGVWLTHPLIFLPWAA